MPFFDDFMEEERVLIISLPYKVGVWVSQADDVAETEADDDKEFKALRAVLSGIAKEKQQAPFVSEIVDQTLTYQNMWPEWKAASGQTLEDVQRVIDMMRARLPEENVRNYARALKRIATVVAHAYGEFEGAEGEQKDEGFFGGVITKILERVPESGEAENPENVSPAEQAALKKLSEILDR